MRPTPGRGLLVIAAVGVLALCGCSDASTPTASTGSPTASPARSTASPAPTPSSDTRLATALGTLEQQDGARIGVAAAVVGTAVGTKESIGYRADERFAFDSTGKLFSAALLLQDSSDAELDATVRFTAHDLVDHSPITSQHVASGMPLRDVIAAALQYSDNTAENLMLAQLGGPAAVQQRLRELGDPVTDVDRTETALNSAAPGDMRDTTTPAQMAADLQLFTLGDALPATRRELLLQLMGGNTTGGAGIRAGVPSGWAVADKTGSGGYGTSNDVAVVTRPDGTRIVLAIYTSGTTADAAPPSDLIAKVTAATVDALA